MHPEAGGLATLESGSCAGPADSSSWLSAALLTQRAEILGVVEREHEALLRAFEAHAAETRREEPQQEPRSDKNQKDEFLSPSLFSPLQPAIGHHEDVPKVEPVEKELAEEALVKVTEDLETSPDSLSKSPGVPSTRSPGIPSITSTGSLLLEGEVPLKWTESFPRSVSETVGHPIFEVSFAMLIVANVVVNVAELDIQGHDIGHRLRLPDFPQSVDEVLPGLPDALIAFNMIFGCLFTLEAALKIAALRMDFVKSPLNIFDLLLVILWIIDQAGRDTYFDFDPMLLRLLRLAKLVRLLRIFKALRQFEVFDTMHVLIVSLKGCWRVLLWSSILFGSIMVLMALAMSAQLQSSMDDPTRSVESRRKLFRYFGTFSRSFLTCFEITLANWVPVCRLLVDEVSEAWRPFFLIYRALVGFAVVKVVSAVFMHETFKCAGSDDELVIRQKKRATLKLLEKLHRFCLKMDTSHDGRMSFEEFDNAMQDPALKSWLSAMQLQCNDNELVWNTFCDHREDIDQMSINDLTTHFARCAGGAKKMDLEIVKAILIKQGHLLQELQAAVLHAGKTSDVQHMKPSDLKAVFEDLLDLKWGAISSQSPARGDGHERTLQSCVQL